MLFLTASRAEGIPDNSVLKAKQKLRGEDNGGTVVSRPHAEKPATSSGHSEVPGHD